MRQLLAVTLLRGFATATAFIAAPPQALLSLSSVASGGGAAAAAAAAAAAGRVCTSPLASSAPLASIPRRNMAAMAAAGSVGAEQEEPVMVMDAFAMRQFDDPNYTGTQVQYDPKAFQDAVNKAHKEGAPLVDGYAPFCKHIFMPNFAGVKTSMVEITPDNRHLLRSGYEARTAEELPVLSQWFPRDTFDAPEAKFLDIILYSREQIRMENAAKGAEEGSNDSMTATAPWGIISVKAQDVDHEIPMQPITMMRNALGAEEGGSGVPLDKTKYMESYNFWKDHAPLK